MLKATRSPDRKEIAVALFGFKRGTDQPCDDLAMVGPALGDAIDRFTRTIKVSPRATTRASNLAAHFPRLRPAKSRRPVRLPLLRAEALRSRTPKTVLNRRRVPSARRPGTRPAVASSIEDSAGRVAGAIRDRLQALRDALLRLRRRLGGTGR
jgi:hypothetical protein